MSKNQLMHLSCSVALACFAITALPARTFAADDIPDTMGSHTDGDTAYINGSAGDRADDTGYDSNNVAFDDDGSEATDTSEKKFDILDFAFGYHCENPVSYDSGHMMFPTYWRCDDPPPSATPSEPPSTRTLLRRAAVSIRADGAGIYKQPPHVSYTNKYIPTIVSVTNPTQTHTVSLFGREVTVTFKATNYEWDWGDGTPHTITAYHGMAFEKGMDPNKDPRLIRHYYTPPNGWRSRFDGPYPDATRTITLTTTWSGTATNPFTGETQTINGLVTTTETTGPFYLDHLTVSNTDTWEEKQGH